ncbi:hypothetical protein [Photorhabdus bodei]|uniref:Uncharacterized protein n=1 Tax=Photorhabdus bodei TaxID=2029681 RepID=A0A329XAD1_9GAMM|nr:hypothetical protein [Photorhabdus bodei]NDK98620.1 hypothetical protein [Photorhabdus bodei]NDL02873.1 hypothetical protein [Photorhabdus bodei]NDL07078.1 hypothetical protein [Photorhabdus bodei]RAX13797.1 hypothetical protein CKY02_04965 [Photorhabdus bodei]
MSNSIKGGDAAKRYLKQLAKKIGEGKKLRAGFFKDATYPDGTSVAMVAISNEIGDPKRNRPPRPFFRNTINEHANEWGDVLAQGLSANDMNGDAALRMTGEVIKGQIQQSIRSFTSPGNAESTIAKKGFDVPLRDTKHMLNSVDYVVDEGNE